MSKSYDLVRYVGLPFAQTHPDRLATMAALFGMTPAPIHHARILEIGCCDGGNLLPMAMSLPASEFVGIDLTEADIASARQTAAALNLPNIQFHALDLSTLPGPLGQFDYVIAHGVYSWVPDQVRDRLIEVTRELLSPNGVAYISYNTFPGGYLRIMIREMMLFHNRGVQNPAEILSRSRQLLEYIASTAGGDDEYHSFIRKEVEQMFSRPDYGLFHDELEENYHPVHFHDFVAHANRHGLQYLSEANYFDMRPEALGTSVSPVLAELGGDPIVREQYLDFARCRRFRQTLLCHQEIALDRPVRAERLKAFHFASPARKVVTEGDQDQGAEEFHGPQDSKIKTAHPLVLQILHGLIAAWPRAVRFEDLPGVASDPAAACDILHALFGSGLVEVRTASPELAVTPGVRPVASPLARMQAARSTPITTLRHTVLTTNGAMENRLISLLDGTRTRGDLVDELAPLLQTGKSISELEAELDVSLNTLGRLCLLVA